MKRVLLVTNDFPPRVGGIQSYLGSIYGRLPAHGIEVRVLAPAFEGDEAHDRAAPVEVVRWDGSMWRGSGALRRRVAELSRDVDAIAFGAVVPSSSMAPKLDRPIVVHTHGFEVGWARTPALRALLARILRSAALVTVVSDYTRPYIERAGAPETQMLRTGVDLERFNPGIDPTPLRKRYGLDDRPVVACVSRLVPRKGQDQILKAMPAVLRAVPDAAALIVGGGSYQKALRQLAEEKGIERAVVFTGEVAEDELAAHYAAGDIFAMPCRSRYAKLEVEGLGLVYLEAQACARPAIAGDSGGAPEAVIDGETGLVVGGKDTDALADAIALLLGDRGYARTMGEAGRRFVEAEHDWSKVVARLASMLNAL